MSALPITDGIPDLSGTPAWAQACAAGAADGLTALRAGSTERDRHDLRPGQVEWMQADLRARLLARYGTADERALDGSAGSAARQRRAAPSTVPVHFHVIADGAKGALTRAQVEDQLATMNRAYAGGTGGSDTGIRFTLRGYEISDRPAWFRAPQRYEKTFKKQLHRGGRETLNLYTTEVGTDVLGFSTFPQMSARAPVVQDGVVVDYRSLPGGPFEHFSKGYTAVHETGHWLGLLHTFENGCDAPGDSVDDTPPEAEPTDGCPAKKDTCPQKGGDPVHNFMDYGYDECMTEFTAGQGRRLRAVWKAYRAPDSTRSVSAGG